MKKIIMFLMIVVLSVSAHAGWIITNTDTGDSHDYGIVDGTNGYFFDGILDKSPYYNTGSGYYTYGVYDGMQGFTMGIIDNVGNYHQGGLLDPADGTVKNGIWDGSYHPSGLLGYVDSVLTFSNYGVMQNGLDWLFYNGILSHSTYYGFGVLDSHTGDREMVGLCDENGNIYTSGIIGTDSTFYDITNAVNTIEGGMVSAGSSKPGFGGGAFSQ